MDLIVEGKRLAITGQGFLVDRTAWNDQVAQKLAEREHLELTEAHWEIIRFIRAYYDQYQHLPNTRIFIKAIAHTLGEAKGNSRYLHRLFPDGPLKYACKLAGLPMPPACL